MRNEKRHNAAEHDGQSSSDQEQSNENGYVDTEPMPLLGYRNGDGPSLPSAASLGNSSSSRAGKCITRSRGPTKQLALTLLVMTVGMVLVCLWRGGTSITNGISPAISPSISSETFSLHSIPDPDRPIPIIASDPRSFKNVSALRERFQNARNNYLTKLREDYGDGHFTNIFVHDGVFIGRLALQPASATGLSWDRMKRKIVMKLLEVQLLSDSNSRMVQFVWATGGHSAAAAHGDLFNESYTAVLQRAVQPVYAELGIWFQSRSYAMGGTSSGPEVALCEESIFGLDIDVLSWDFGMTDSNNVANMELYFRQAGLHPNRPACVGLEIQGRLHDSRVKILQNLERSGLTVLHMPTEVMTDVLARIPDSMGLNSTDLKAMPPFLRSFKCEGFIEKGSPGCSAGKWTDVKSVCSAVKFRTGWHPGWKWHALLGNMISLALLELLDDALTYVEKLDNLDPTSLYSDLKAQEDAEYKLFVESNLTSGYEAMIKHKKEENLDFDIPFLFKNRAYCHTALLPAESRYLGILTETSHVGFFHYDKGTSRKKAESQPGNNTQLTLVFEPRERQDCSIQLQIDYKDFFFLTEAEGTKKLVLPNKAELELYERPRKGLVGFSLAGCEWGKCDKSEAREIGLNLEEWEMHINGVQVTNFTMIQRNVNFVRHKDGQYFVPNEEGQYEIRIRIKAVGKFLRFSSFIIF